MIKTIIVDDEPTSVNVLSMLLQEECKHDVQVVATTNSPQVAKALIEKHKPDLLFLDIHMDGQTGIEFLQSFSEPSFHVVFVTAYDAYAIEAFRLNAIDYLLKPVEADDIVRVIQKVKNRQFKEDGTQLQNLKQLLSDYAGHDNKIAVAMAEKIVFIHPDDIIYCEAQGAYTTLYLQGEKPLLVSKNIGEFEIQLGHRKFFRIHNSIVINLNKIREFQKQDGGYVVMENGTKLAVSHRKRKDFLESINHRFLK